MGGFLIAVTCARGLGTLAALIVLIGTYSSSSVRQYSNVSLIAFATASDKKKKHKSSIGDIISTLLPVVLKTVRLFFMGVLYHINREIKRTIM